MRNWIKRFFGVFDRRRIPAQPLFTGLAVHYGGPGQSGVRKDDFLKMALSWLEGHSQEPLRSEVRGFLETRWISMTDTERRPGAHSDLALLRLSNPRGEEIELLESATRVAILVSLDPSLHPRTGYWAALLSLLLAALAQRLTEEAQEQAGRWEGELKDIEVPGEISIRLIDILRAGGRGDSFLTVVPPPSYRGRHEAWLGGLCRGFFRQGGSPVPGGTDLS